MKTPQELKRSNVKSLFDSVLKSDKTMLAPLSIATKESSLDELTSVTFSFEEKRGKSKKQISLKNIEGSGFVDALFKGCLQEYGKKYVSLLNITLIDLKVNPIFSLKKHIMGTDAETDICFSVEIKNHGLAEFRSRSRSIIYSSFITTLEAFQFYINCERVFFKIKKAAEGAKERNRGDIHQRCLSELSMITEMNSYEI